MNGANIINYGLTAVSATALVVFVISFKSYKKRNDKRYLYFSFIFLGLFLFFGIWSAPAVFNMGDGAIEFAYKISVFFLYFAYASGIRFVGISIRNNIIWSLLIPITMLVTGATVVIMNFLYAGHMRVYELWFIEYKEPIMLPFLKYITGSYAMLVGVSASSVFWKFFKSDKKVLKVRAILLSIGFVAMPVAGLFYYYGSAIYQYSNIIPAHFVATSMVFVGVAFIAAGFKYRAQELSSEERRLFIRPVRNMTPTATEIDISG